LRTGEGRVKGWERSRIRRQKDSQVLYNSSILSESNPKGKYAEKTVFFGPKMKTGKKYKNHLGLSNIVYTDEALLSSQHFVFLRVLKPLYIDYPQWSVNC
jgi:hypothetical protein